MSMSKKPLEQFGHGGKQIVEESSQAVSEQLNLQSQIQKHFAISTSIGQLMPGNSATPMQTSPQDQQGIHIMANKQVVMAALLQAIQALALERNIELSLPQNANLMTQLMQGMQSRMLGQQKANESNMAPQSLPNESSPRSDVSGHLGSTKARQAMSPGHLWSTSNLMLVNASSCQGQQFLIHGRETQLPPTVNNGGMSSMPPPQLPANMSQGADHFGKSIQ